MSERLTGAQLAEILKATTNLECAADVVQLITEYERRPVEDAEIVSALAYVDKNWVSIWRRINAGGLVQHQRELARVLDEYVAAALSDSKREIGQLKDVVAKAADYVVQLRESNIDLMAREAQAQHQLLTVTNELEGSQAQFKSHTEHVGQFLNGMYATMIDPLDDEPRKVADTCELLLKAAQQQRQKIEDLTNELERERKLLQAAKDLLRKEIMTSGDRQRKLTDTRRKLRFAVSGEVPE